MFNFYNSHKTFDRVDEKELKKQLDAAYHAGLSGKDKVEANDAARTKSAANITALNRTLELFADLNPSRSLVKLSRERLEQEQKWLAHYDKCIERTKQGFAQLNVNAAALKEEAFAAGKADMEKHIKARVEQERATAARLLAEQQERNKKNNDNNNNRDRDNNGNDKNRDRDNNKKGATIVVDRMIVREEVKSGKDKKKNKGKQFHSLKKD